MKTTRTQRILVISLLTTFLYQNAFTQNDLQTDENAALIIIIDRTKTPTGRLFYKAFNDQWKEAGIQEDQIITIEELPAPSRSTKMIVKLNTQQIWTKHLPPNRSLAQKLGAYAALFTRQHLAQQANLEEELNGDMNGSGIY